MSIEMLNDTKPELAIDAVELTRLYGTFPAVDKISFFVPAGTIFGLLGPNGAGKSTTIKMLTTLLPPTSGTAKVFGCDIVDAPSKVREKIGYVSQAISADGDLTGYENLLLSTKLYGLPREGRDERIREILDFMKIGDVADTQVNRYSGGMIRRLEIAQALVHNPSILFLDEPSIGLDPAARKNVWQYIRQWKEKYGTTIFITTHDMDEADKLCDTVAFMYRGKIAAIDSPAKLKAEIGSQTTLDDVFIRHTGASIIEGGNFDQAQATRQTISHLD